MSNPLTNKSDLAEGSLNEFVPPSSGRGDGNGESERNRRIRILLGIAIEAAKRQKVGSMGDILAMNTIAGDDFFSVAVQGILPDLSDREYMFVLESAYKTVKQGMTEGKDFNRCFDQACKLYDRAVSKNLEPKLVQVADFQGDGNGADPRWMKLPQHVWQHYVVIVGDQVLDPTAKQFGDSMPTQYKVSDLDRLWGKQYQIRPRQGVAEGEVVPLGKKHRGDLDSVNSCSKCGGKLEGGTYMGQRIKVCLPCKQVYLPPNSGIDQQGNKIKEQGVAENFDDGKKPGRKGLAKRVGVDCKQPISKLRSIASNSSGERQRMAHWCANMKSGRKK
jgi:hypothetical protein